VKPCVEKLEVRDDLAYLIWLIGRLVHSSQLEERDAPLDVAHAVRLPIAFQRLLFKVNDKNDSL
jgi:hypothetical protein